MKNIYLVLLLCFAFPAFAVGPDLSALTNAMDFGTVVTAILAAAAVIAVVLVAKVGAGWILYFISGDYKIEGEEEDYRD